MPALDDDALWRADERRLAVGRSAHFAAERRVDFDPWHHGAWDTTAEGRARWRLRIRSLGAQSLSLALDRFVPTPKSQLWIEGRPGTERLGPFDASDVDAHGSLWIPPLTGDRLTLVVVLPVQEIDAFDLHVGRIHHGYAGFGDQASSGSCHPDAACSPVGSWQEAASAVGLLTIDGVRYCTGFLVNNTARDRRPLLLTAHHCGITRANAASVVVLWGQRQDVCGGAESPALRFQTGAKVLAAMPHNDLTLLELDDPAPANAAFVGWDRSDDEPRRAATLHHPNTDHLRLAVAADLRTTRHLEDQRLRGADHLRVVWRLGSTEGGSSGAPLLDEAGRAVGVLHGGYAACGDDGADWFSRLSAAWDSGLLPATRLRDWLDPLETQAPVLDLLAPRAAPAP
ncbi:MAG: serine protease [Acidobacteriota bacterium]